MDVWMDDMAYIEDGIWPGVHGWVNGQKRGLALCTFQRSRKPPGLRPHLDEMIIFM